MKAANKNNVKRVIMVSALAAIIYGKQKSELDKVFNESHWTNENNNKDTTLDVRGKTIAEKTAWEFIEQNNSELELTTVLPGTILGPVLEKYHGRSAHLITKLLDSSSGSLPKVGFEIVDVRSVADLLIKAMETPQAANERYIASSEYLTYKEIALLLQEHFPDRNMSISVLPYFAAKLASYFEPALEHVLIKWGKKREVDKTKANKELQWQPLPADDTVIACAESILENEIIK